MQQDIQIKVEFGANLIFKCHQPWHIDEFINFEVLATTEKLADGINLELGHAESLYLQYLLRH